MKKIVIIVIAVALLALFHKDKGAAEKIEPLNTASITPSSASSYLKIDEIEKTIKGSNSPMHNIKTNAWFSDFISKTEVFKSKTGIDLLNSKSLINAGIDIKKSLSIALWKKDAKPERMIIFLPVKDANNFYLRFIDILKKSITMPNVDLKPEITNYKNFITGQMLKDIFFTSIGNYFILTPSLKLIHRILDLRINESNETPLSEDHLYKQYIKRNNRYNDYGINIFMKRDFLIDTIFKDISISIPEKKNTSNSAVAADSAPQKQNEKNCAKFNYIDYLGIGIKSNSNGMKIGISFAINPESPDFIYLQDLFKTGLVERAIYIKNPLLYCFSSINSKGLDDLIKNNSNIKKYEDYNTLKNGIKRDLGIDLADRFFPNSTSVFNYIIEQPKTQGRSDNFILFIPIINNHDIGVWKNIWKTIKKNTKKNSKFGSKKIKGIESYWFRNERGGRINIFKREKGFYISNNVQCMMDAIDNEKKSITEINDHVFHTIDSDTFLVVSLLLEKESMFKMILRLLLFSRPELINLLERNNNITVIGKRIDNTLFFDIRMR